MLPKAAVYCRLLPSAAERYRVLSSAADCGVMLHHDIFGSSRQDSAAAGSTRQQSAALGSIGTVGGIRQQRCSPAPAGTLHKTVPETISKLMESCGVAEKARVKRGINYSFAFIRSNRADVGSVSSGIHREHV